MPNKYEILVMIDPKEDKLVIENIINKVFKKVEKFEQLERTELAYRINNSLAAHYFLINVIAEGPEISEFNRRINIVKTIWRAMVINLDSERGLNRKASEKKFIKKPNVDRQRRQRDSSTEPRTYNSSERTEKKPFTRKKVQNENELK